VKILVVCTTGGSQRRQFGGVEHLLVQLLPALVERGVEIVAATPDDAVGAALREHGVRWVELAARTRIDPAYARAIGRLVRAERPDIVDAQLLSAAMHCRAALAVRHRTVPLVVTLHNSLWQYRENAPTAAAKRKAQSNIALDLALRRIRPHMSVAVSDFEAGELRVRGGVRQLRLIPNPLPREWPAPDLREPTGRIGFMGRLEQEKGAHLLGAIARALPDLELAVAGLGQVPVPDLPNVTAHGHVDPAKFLSGLDCLLVPSGVEAFGMSAAQGLSLGVPVVHTGVGGLAEVTRHAEGRLAFRTAPDPAAIAASVRTALGASDRMEIARWYQRQFAFHDAVGAWHDLYRSMVDERR
jgi:glycosyltransferase involved in cell wall biosynthesis